MFLEFLIYRFYTDIVTMERNMKISLKNFYSIYITLWIGLCGVKEFGHPDPLYTKPKAHAEEEEMPEDE